MKSTCYRSRFPHYRRIASQKAFGLTATLIREDGREGDVFALIGPKRYDVPWRNWKVKDLSPLLVAPR